MKTIIVRCSKSLREFLPGSIRHVITKFNKVCGQFWGSRFIFKICILNLLTAAAATGMFGIYIYFNTFEKTKEQLFENSRKNLQEVMNEIASAVRRVETQAASISMNEIFKESMEGLGEKEAGDVYAAYLKLDKLCAEIENVDNLYDIAIVFEEHYRMMHNRDRVYYDDMGILEKPEGKESFRMWNYDEIPGVFMYGLRSRTGDGKAVLLLFGIREKVYQSWLHKLRFLCFRCQLLNKTRRTR